jgi:hypothetical protein
MLIIIPQSHLDHHLSLRHLRFVLDRCQERNSFFIESVTLPDELPALSCALRGPVVGNPPVTDAEITMRSRNGRAWESRMLTDPHKPVRVALDMGKYRHWDYDGTADQTSRIVTIIGGPADGFPCVLYTAYGGPLAPREPGDPSLPEAERAASVAFWAEHALVK